MHRGMDWLEVVGRWGGTYNGACGGDVSKKKTKAGGAYKCQKRRKPSRLGLRFACTVGTEVVDDGGRWWGVVGKMVGVVGGAYLMMRAGAAGVWPRYESELPGLGFARAWKRRWLMMVGDGGVHRRDGGVVGTHT